MMVPRGRGGTTLQEREWRPHIPQFERGIDEPSDPELELAWAWIVDEEERLGVLPYHDDYQEHMASRADRRQRTEPRPEDSY